MDNVLEINKCGCGGSAYLGKNQNWKWVRCVKCGNSTAECHLAVSEESVIEEWNDAHPEYIPLQKEQYHNFLQSLVDSSNISSYAFNTLLNFDYPIFEQPKVSKVDEVYQWLKKGEIVTDGSFKYRIHNDCFQRLHGDCWEPEVIGFQRLLESEWRLYEEPKYREVSFLDALAQYLTGIRVTAYFKDEDEEFTLQENDEHGIGLSNARLAKGKCLTTETIKNADWRIYEEAL